MRIKTIQSSLIIEGNGLSEEVVTAILDGKKVLGNPQDILEVKNTKRAYVLLDELDPYSVKDLLRVHREMMTNLIPGTDCFRSGNVGVFGGDQLIHVGTPACCVPEVVADGQLRREGSVRAGI